MSRIDISCGGRLQHVCIWLGIATEENGSLPQTTQLSPSIYSHRCVAPINTLKLHGGSSCLAHPKMSPLMLGHMDSSTTVNITALTYTVSKVGDENNGSLVRKGNGIR